MRGKDDGLAELIVDVVFALCDIVAVRRLFDDESPFGLVLRWADLSHNDAATLERTLRSKRIVLQENETGDIVWEHFSPAELNTFLGLLHREENDYRQRIQLKFEAAKREILRLMKERWEASPELQKRVPKNSLPWECDSSERATKVASKFNLDAVVDKPVTGNAVVTPTGTLLSRSSWGSFDPRYDSVEDLRTATNDQSADADAESTDPWQRRKELAGTLPSRLVTKNDKEKVRKKKNSPADGLKQKEASSSAAPVRRRGLFSRKK